MVLAQDFSRELPNECVASTGRNPQKTCPVVQVELEQGFQLLIVKVFQSRRDFLADASRCRCRPNLQEILLPRLGARLRPVSRCEIGGRKRCGLLYEQASGGEGEPIAISHLLSPPAMLAGSQARWLHS